MRAGEIGAQPLAGLQLMRLDQRAGRRGRLRRASQASGLSASSTVTLARPSSVATCAFGQCQMLAAKRIDRRALRLGWAAMRFFHARARRRCGIALDLPGELCLRHRIHCPIAIGDSIL